MIKMKKFRILRNILHTLGLSKESSNDVVDWIANLVASEEEEKAQTHHKFLHPSTKNESNQLRLPYAKRDDFLSQAELNFYRILTHIIKGRAIVFTKVALSDIFYVKSKDRSEYQTFLNKIDRKHVDFLLCDVISLQPLCGIELDDKSHKRKDRQERDRFVDAVFEISDLPIVHVPVNRSYVTSKLEKLFEPYLKEDDIPNDTASFIAVTSSSMIPTCPKCKSEMTLRIAKRGENAGKEFWGCTNYPRCRAIIQIAEVI